MRQEVWDISQLNDFYRIIEDMVNEITHGTIYLHGDLGVGKTAFVRYWLQYSGVSGAISSPSYQIVNTYAAQGKRFLHADLYRLAEADELLYLDVRDWPDQADLIFIEWPEKGDGYLPPPDVICQFSLSGTQRTLSCTIK